MKKWYLASIVFGIILAVVSCGGSEKLPIPSAAISKIYALNETKTVNGFVEVKEVQDRAEFCYIMIYIKSHPEKDTTLDDAIDTAKVFTGTLAKSAVNILKGYDINQDVSVWAQLPLKEGGVEVLGHAKYTAKHDTFHDFVRLEQ